MLDSNDYHIARFLSILMTWFQRSEITLLVTFLFAGFFCWEVGCYPAYHSLIYSMMRGGLIAVLLTLRCPRTWHYFMTHSKNSQHKVCFAASRSIRYFILLISLIQVVIALYAMSSRGGTEAFVSLWSAIFLLILCVGGTVIMRKFQSSLAVGFFMGSVVAASQMFMLIFLMWVQLAISVVTHAFHLRNDKFLLHLPALSNHAKSGTFDTSGSLGT